MALIKVEVEVSKETYELGQGLAKIVEAVMIAAKDGFQVGQDLPAVAMTAFAQMTAINGIDKIGEEMKNDPAAFYKALGLASADIYGVFKQNKEEEPVA